MKDAKETQRQGPKGTPDRGWEPRRVAGLSNVPPEYYFITSHPTQRWGLCACLILTPPEMAKHRQVFFNPTEKTWSNYGKRIHNSLSAKLETLGSGRWSVDKVLVIEVVLSLVCLLSIFIENQLAADTWLNSRLSVLVHYSAFSGFCCCFYFCIFFSVWKYYAGLVTVALLLLLLLSKLSSVWFLIFSWCYLGFVCVVS